MSRYRFPPVIFVSHNDEEEYFNASDKPIELVDGLTRVATYKFVEVRQLTENPLPITVKTERRRLADKPKAVKK